ncbi:MAG: beta-galactosidase [Prolixibacteraceae bacterium]|nr:beta-galactosidase [Prolixibacteraceae bacterium]
MLTFLAPSTSFAVVKDIRSDSTVSSPITYDGKSLKINGKRTLLISGAFHYPRSTPDMWPQMLKESKSAGLNCIETYVFWEGHERQEGKYDFSERYNLPLFLDLCQKNGLYVILRVGPYICAEWNYGGLPWWLATKPGLVTRTWNKPYMDAMESWVMELGRQVANRQISNGGPIILVQMENEYKNVAKRYGEEGQKYLAWAEQLGHRAGFNVPMIMCEGASPSSIETLNGNSVWKRIEELHKRRPDQPAIWTENWVAWYDIWGEKHHTMNLRVVIPEIIRFFAAGGAGMNYYMWHGGTNFGRTAMYLGTTSYDYDAALDEYGLPTPNLQNLKLMHTFLQHNAGIILEGSRSPVQSVKQNGKEVVQVCSVNRADSVLDFVFNMTDSLKTVNMYGVDLSLQPKGVVAMEKSDGSFKVAYRSWDQPTLLPKVNLITANVCLSWTTRLDPLPTGVSGAAKFKVVQLPHNMLAETRDETDYGWYRTSVTREKAGLITLAARVSDRLSVWVNGKFIGTVPDRLPENRKLSGPYLPADNDAKKFALQIKVPLVAGKNELLLLVSTLGMIKGDWMIDLPMSQTQQGLLSPVYLDGQIINQQWSFAAGMVGEHNRWFTTGGAKTTDWKPYVKPAQLSWFRSSFTLTPKEISGDPWMLDAEGLGKGMIWVNGRNIGRYWQDAGPQRYYHVPSAWLKAGANELVIFEENNGTPQQVNLIRRHLTMEPAIINN